MPKFNVDEKASVFEPIEVTLEGQTYVIESVTSNMIKEISNHGGSEDLDSVAKQMAILTKAPYENFVNVDIRKVGSALKFITDTIMSQVEGGDQKNG